jgi:hypothetical protein
MQHVGAKPPFLHGPRLEVLDQDVGRGHQVADELLAGGDAQIGGDRLLVARDHLPPQLGLAMAPVAHGIAAAFAIERGRFDLDDLGAHVAQKLAAEWASDQLAEFQHPNADECAVVVHPVSPLSHPRREVSGLRNHAGQRLAHHAGEPLRRADQRIEIEPGGHA